MHDGYPWDLLRTDWGNTTHVVVSELRRDELADLMKLDPASIHVIPNGVDAARFYKLESQTQALLDTNKSSGCRAHSASACPCDAAQEY